MCNSVTVIDYYRAVKDLIAAHFQTSISTNAQEQANNKKTVTAVINKVLVRSFFFQDDV